MEADPIPLPHDTIHLKGHLSNISKIVLLPDGKRIATASYDQTVRIYSITSGSRLQTLRGHNDAVLDLAVIDEDTILALCYRGRMYVWRLSTGSMLCKEDFGITGTMTRENRGKDGVKCASLGDGRLVAGLSEGGLSEVHWDGTALHIVRKVLNAHDEKIIDIAVLDKRFVSVSAKSVRVWDADKFECLAALAGHTSGINCVAFREDYIVTGSFQELRFYDASTFDFVRDVDAHSDKVWKVKSAENKDIVVSSGLDKTIAAHSISSGCCLWRIEAGINPVCLEVLPNGTVATAGTKPFDIRLIPGLLQSAASAAGETGQVEETWPRPIKDVFISHAGPDKLPFAVPLYQELHRRNVSAFLDLEELQPGDDAPQRMTDALQTSPILVVITSPEYCARKWTIKELSCVLQRDEEALEKARRLGQIGLSSPRPGEGGRPIIIPVFYRLNLQQCKNLNFVTDVSDVDERNLRRYHEMLNRMDSELQVMRECMAALGAWTGIENDLNVTNEDTPEMQEIRAKLIAKVADAIEKAVRAYREVAGDVA